MQLDLVYSKNNKTRLGSQKASDPGSEGRFGSVRTNTSSQVRLVDFSSKACNQLYLNPSNTTTGASAHKDLGQYNVPETHFAHLNIFEQKADTRPVRDDNNHFVKFSKSFYIANPSTFSNKDNKSCIPVRTTQ